ISMEEKQEILARLGPDPLREDADPRRFFASVAKSKTPIGALLMDQSKLCGVGNVYRAEENIMQIQNLERYRGVMPSR
ncbi:MAG: hypothetical protein EBT84_11390, partial [Sphingomonadaceae bacterium]|nr:hypothetical protein [Sphingomonadaceae bacterium]